MLVDLTFMQQLFLLYRKHRVVVKKVMIPIEQKALPGRMRTRTSGTMSQATVLGAAKCASYVS